ncbi:lytic transglycosylase domain-containing protein [Aureimonas sp. AU4]|uniref:lytic transglycosylase domain-containing protein n=1 Tax=Aureimonas sp. AU4 TaxID=1638163 RepID=UPI00070593FA|nr:transglycosylase SLT domain-containing protein [Aureimonas sp. AU4]BAT30372.1 probable transglycosylase protein [Aureimonas sp. AU4]
MTYQRAEEARFARLRAGRFKHVATFAILAPLILTGCVSQKDTLTGTADLTPASPAGTQVAEAPKAVEIASADGGPSRVILPQTRPGAEPVQVAAAATPTAERGERVARVQAPRSLAGRALDTASAAKDAAALTAIAAKDTVVAGAAKVGSGAVHVASVSVATVQNVAQAVSDTITGDPKIDRMIEKAADENEIPRELAYAVVRVESHYNPRAKGAGVYGLSQIKPATARGLGFSGPAEALLDPETNLRYGMRYLKGAWEEGNGDVCQTAMKYKGGHRTTVMTKSASVYCSNVKRHMASIRARKTPAMGPDRILVAAVEPTPRKGLIARSIATAAPTPLPGVSAAALIAPTAAQAAPASASAAIAPAAVARVALPSGAPRTAEAAPEASVPPSVKVAENRPVPLLERVANRPASTGGRVVRAAPEPDASRFGGTFDASGPSTGAAAPAGGLGFN